MRYLLHSTWEIFLGLSLSADNGTKAKKVKTNSVSLSRGTMLDCLMPSLYTESAPEISARFPTPDLLLINILYLGPAGAINPPSVRICDCSGSRSTELIWAESERARTHGTAALG